MSLLTGILILFPVFLLFGLPALVAVILLTCLTVRFHFFRHQVFRSVAPFAPLFLPLIGFCLGSLTGYYAVWVDHQSWFPSFSKKWYHVFSIPGWPGALLAEVCWLNDAEDAAWSERYTIATYNGCFWASIGLVAIPLVYSFYREMISRKTVQESTASCHQLGNTQS